MSKQPNIQALSAIGFRAAVCSPIDQESRFSCSRSASCRTWNDLPAARIRIEVSNVDQSMNAMLEEKINLGSVREEP